MLILVLMFDCKDVDVPIYLDKMPPGGQITLIIPQTGGLEIKCNIDRVVLKELNLFARAFTGTDTTSTAYRRGNAQACHLLRKGLDLSSDIAIFYNKDVSQKDIAVAGERLVWC